MELELTSKWEGTSLLIALNGELNTLTAPEFKELIEENLPNTDRLSFDFAGCDFVSSAGLRVLLNTFKSMKRKGGTMELLNVGPNFSEVLNITGLDRVFGLK